MEFVKDAFGEQVNDMYDLQMLATAPEAQGQGYGSAGHGYGAAKTHCSFANLLLTRQYS